MKPTLIKIAASSLAMGFAMVGYSPVANSSTVAESDSRDERDAARDAAEAREALSKDRAERAVRHAERAVEKMPRSAEYRHLLGRAYLADGRFDSAETSFQDALTIDPDLTRTAFNLALAQIAQGNSADALAELTDLEGRMGASDLGLAIALAGNRERAIEILQQAARANGGDPKARQNLALAYALDGRWAEARITAAQDVSMAQLDQRMQEWIRFAQPENSWDQISSLLGVEAETSDPGQPQRLALAPIQAETMTAEYQPAEAFAPVETDPVVAFTAPAETGVTVAAATPIVSEVDVPAFIPADPTPVRIAPTPPRVAGDYAPPREIAFIVEEENEAIEMASTAPVAFPPAPPPAPAPVAAPVAMTAPESADPEPVRRSSDGRFMVQIGAFARQSNVDVAWNRAVRRYGELASYEPSRTTLERSRTLYRLSFGGFHTRGDADRMCRTLKGRGVDCFVRARAGDAPLRIAARSGSGLAALR